VTSCREALCRVFIHTGVKACCDGANLVSSVKFAASKNLAILWAQLMARHLLDEPPMTLRVTVDELNPDLATADLLRVAVSIDTIHIVRTTIFFGGASFLKHDRGARGFVACAQPQLQSCF
jgi:hypothetical protein